LARSSSTLTVRPASTSSRPRAASSSRSM
jgi:hypothetical protein